MMLEKGIIDPPMPPEVLIHALPGFEIQALKNPANSQTRGLSVNSAFSILSRMPKAMPKTLYIKGSLRSAMRLKFMNSDSRAAERNEP